MTTKPKARKFRIRRAEPQAAAPEADRVEPMHGGAASAQAVAAEVATPEEAQAEDQALAAIEQEGLTGRQLRMARRVAQKHGIVPKSDFDAVRLLRERGIDPFQRATLLELVKSDAEDDNQNLPETYTAPPPVAPDESAEANRAREIIAMQQDIARRRRRKLTYLMVRLAIFVFLPTLIGWYYFANMATPLYSTKSELIIQQADGMTTGGGVGGLLSGTSFATATDSISVQSYLQSRDAMLRLDAEHNLRDHFAEADIDSLQRLDADGSNEQMYKLYRRNVKIGYDPTEGLIRLEVIAADPEKSVEFSNALISYAEEQVDNLTQRKREDQMQGALVNYEDATEKVIAAQAEVLALQEQIGILDPVAETSLLMSQISNFDTQLREKRLQLQQLLDNSRPNQARVDGVQGDISRLEAVIQDLRNQQTQTTETSESLAKITGQMRMAEAELQARQMLLQSALQEVEASRIEANRQVRYLSQSVRPVAPDVPTYPRVFENTMLTFLIFGGIYLMASLTASILREQVSA